MNLYILTHLALEEYVEKCLSSYWPWYLGKPELEFEIFSVSLDKQEEITMVLLSEETSEKQE